jgi:hypothetical protein
LLRFDAPRFTVSRRGEIVKVAAPMNVKKLVLVVAVSAVLVLRSGPVVRKLIAIHTPRQPGAQRGARLPVALRPHRPAVAPLRDDWVDAVGIQSVPKIDEEDMRAEARADAIGTRIVFRDGRPVVDRRLRKAIAAAFAQLDPLPQTRSEHFAWVGKDKLVRNLEVLGWRGVIKVVRPAPRGWLAEVEFMANFNKCATADSCSERWLYECNGSLTFVPTPHVHRPGILMMD